MALKCPKCEMAGMRRRPYSEKIGELVGTVLQPTELLSLIGRGSANFVRSALDIKGKIGLGSRMQCKNCCAYGTQCPHCKKVLILSNLPKDHSMINCRNCAKKIYFYGGMSRLGR